MKPRSPQSPFSHLPMVLIHEKGFLEAPRVTVSNNTLKNIVEPPAVWGNMGKEGFKEVSTFL